MRILVNITNILDEEQGSNRRSNSGDPLIVDNPTNTASSTDLAMQQQTPTKSLPPKNPLDLLGDSIGSNLSLDEKGGSLSSSQQQFTPPMLTREDSFEGSTCDDSGILHSGSQVSAETRRKLIRQCLDLKRLMDKEGNSIYSGNSPLLLMIWQSRKTKHSIKRILHSKDIVFKSQSQHHCAVPVSQGTVFWMYPIPEF
jgi:hypothetical protein